MEEIFKFGTQLMANVVEVIASVVIAMAVLQAALGAVRVFFRAASEPDAKESLRLRLGHWLAVALEFELAADILRTAVAPTWNEIGQLAAIVVLRTLLNYFLQAEIDRASARQATAPA